MQIKGDKVGPEYVLKVYNPEFNVWGFLVIDNTKLGPGKGGIRMTSSVTEVEVFRLARAMTLKNALAGIPFGGAKSGIVFSPTRHDKKTKRKIIEWFAKTLRPVCPRYYIAGPDVNTGEEDMKWFVEANGSWRAATGKPASYCVSTLHKAKVKCGIPHEFGSTGFGVAQATKIALGFVSQDIRGATIAIEGFGNVGGFAFKLLSKMGAKVVAVSDSGGGIFDENGLDYIKALKAKKEAGTIANYKGAKKIRGDKIFELKVDVLIPAALPDVIDVKNVNKVKAKIIVEGANIPMQEKYEKILHEKGILVVPDIIANAGGVISSYAEYRGYNPKKMFELVARRISHNVEVLLEETRQSRKHPREIAVTLALRRLQISP